MTTIIHHLDVKVDNSEIMKQAGEIVQRGGLVAFPTETVYGLGADAFNEEAAARIYAAKGRPADNPLIVHICRPSDLTRLACDIPDLAYSLADRFWPGPLTLVLPKNERLPAATTGGLDTVAVRMPRHWAALALIEASDGFIAAPSANLSGRPSPTLGKHVLADLNGRIEMILIDDTDRIGLESTVLDLTVSPPAILRPGFVTQDMLGSVVSPDTNHSAPAVARSPGMKYRHYAPQGKMTLVIGNEKAVIDHINEQTALEKAKGHKVGVIASSQTARKYIADTVKCIGDRKDEAAISESLYRILRELDDEITDVIYSEFFDGEAIEDRLMKATGHNMVRI